MPKRLLFLMLALFIAAPLAAQDWEPLGQLPVDQAGAGRRGYVLPGEGADVAAPGADEISFHMVAANSFYREQTTDFLISQRYETHTAALGYRRGFKPGTFPRFEVGAQVQFNESGEGVLNGFISRFEDFWVSLTGTQSAKNRLRSSTGTLPPLGMLVEKDGRPLYQAPGGQSGFGDVYVTTKLLLREGAPSSTAARVAARVAVNISGTSAFTSGNFAGIGLSLDKKLAGRTAFHGDARAQLILDHESQWGLPLKRASFGFSVGPELKIAANTSASVQFDGSTTPYLPTGTAAFDENYGDLTFGVSHRFKYGRRHVLGQVYARENLNLPFRVRWNTDPDLAIGMKITIY